MSYFNVSLIVWAMSQDSLHKLQVLKRKNSRSGSNRGPSAYQPSALPLGHTGYHFLCLSHVIIIPPPPPPSICPCGLPSICPSVRLSVWPSPHLSVRPPVCVFDFVRTVSPEQLFNQTWCVVYYHEAGCHAEKWFHYLHCQGHSEGLYNQNSTIVPTSSKLLVRL